MVRRCRPYRSCPRDRLLLLPDEVQDCPEGRGGGLRGHPLAPGERRAVRPGLPGVQLQLRYPERPRSPRRDPVRGSADRRGPAVLHGRGELLAPGGLQYHRDEGQRWQVDRRDRGHRHRGRPEGSPVQLADRAGDPGGRDRRAAVRGEDEAALMRGRGRG